MAQWGSNCLHLTQNKHGRCQSYFGTSWTTGNKPHLKSIKKILIVASAHDPDCPMCKGSCVLGTYGTALQCQPLEHKVLIKLASLSTVKLIAHEADSSTASPSPSLLSRGYEIFTGSQWTEAPPGHICSLGFLHDRTFTTCGSTLTRSFVCRLTGSENILTQIQQCGNDACYSS